MLNLMVLYNMAATNIELAEKIAKAVKDVDDTLILHGLANSELESVKEKDKTLVFHEAFIDRTYQRWDRRRVKRYTTDHYSLLIK
ncbi:LamB/YcsF family protein [Anaerobacillus sp. HL2]|nr:LamB/YcsF family protein [Anaerobacillus sp. HL2]